MKPVVDRNRWNRRKFGILAHGMLLFALLISSLFGCQGQSTLLPPTTAPTEVLPPSATVQPEMTDSSVFPALTPVPSETTHVPQALPGSTEPPYPGLDQTSPAEVATAYPGMGALPPAAGPYPGVVVIPTNPAYPAVQVTPALSVATASAYPLPAASPTAMSSLPPTSAVSTPGVGITPAQPLPTGRVILPLGTPPASSGTVTIWHSWSPSKAAALMQVVAAFQKSYPDVRFDLLVLPEADLLTRYEIEAYNGGGPSLLIGSSDWTAYLVDRQLVEDLSPYVSSAFRRTVYPSAMATGSYQGQLACLPLNLSGILLYRNTQILPEPASTVEEMLSQAEKATRAGKVGAYLERGFAFSFAHLYGMGGRILNEEGTPAFQEQDYLYSLAWVELLQSFERPGAYAFNDEKDAGIFKQNRSGYLIDGSWNLTALTNAIGAENLVIDPWPSLPEGYLSGYIKAESLFLNINTARKSSADHLATLRFMGYLMTAPVQEYLAEQGTIPSLQAAQPRDPLLAQAHAAFARSTAYPVMLLSKDGALRVIYQDTLNAALVEIFNNGVAPRTALEKALAAIQQRLDGLE